MSGAREPPAASERCRMSRRVTSLFAALCGLLTVAVVVATTALVSSRAAAQTWTEGFCPDENGVTVVVDFQQLGGDTVVRCALGEQTNGLAALENAGFDVTGTDRWGKAFVCRINDRPGPDTEPCVNTPPASAYWSYWHADDGGPWQYSSRGATYSSPPQGSFEGWSFSMDRGPEDNPTPRVDPVRPDPTPSPTPTGETQPTRTPDPTTSVTPTVTPTGSAGPTATPTAGPTGTPSNPHADAARDAARWLSGEFVDGALPGFAGPDWGLTVDGLFALRATGTEPEATAQVADALARHVRSYNSFDDFGVPDVRIAGATAKLLVAAVSVGADPTDFGGYDLRQEVLDLVAGPTAGAEEGRVRDRGTADNSNTFGQSLAVIGLVRSGGVPQPVVDFLIRQQCGSGGFRLSPDLFGTPSSTCDESSNPVLDPDSTAMAVQALTAVAKDGTPSAEDAARKGADWLESIQHADGSFGGSGPTAEANTNSTGLAAAALIAAGRLEAAEHAARYVASMQLTATGAASAERGAIAYNGAARDDANAAGIGTAQRDQWRRATAQALLALAKVPLGQLGDGKGVEPTPTPTNSWPTPTAAVPPSVTPSAGVSASTATGGGPPPSTTGSFGGGSLASTGVSVLPILLVGMGLVGVGYGLHRAARRRTDALS